MMPGEIHADFSSILRDVVGRNRVSERVLLEQFYRCLDKTTKKLIQPDPKPRALEEAVDKATEIDDPMDNVVLGLVNIGQPWVIPMDGTAGQTNVLSGISGAGLAMVLASSTDRGTTAHGGQTVALFTNPQGVYNAYSGTWDPAPGHVWNGKYWYKPKKTERKRNAASAKSAGDQESKRTVAKIKVRREPDSSEMRRLRSHGRSG
ncbi:hypothetical protein PC129_g21359 [Phytophthora cactorum]|uniref:Uncharacterized protein n=1 Tax=Phytophthora cactorum TaxID=29920 RepID=A0A8T1JVG4_9STRA|nr:hypothetical protein Pcac1_g10524 [Phytophthora cactorum]KAG2796390.1 hypothetical protein PC111_g21748 [Phytophthora cactorum]KAG2889391.1 hypothetical protein PC115_g19769 [Phytophthora cactorum]KAG2961610.1 hypothetical protein PC118_g21874 [Phytophthora cactorum]KAG3054037.1 hypothetical protein PC122_g22157 [Phytophthora cactorum]